MIATHAGGAQAAHLGDMPASLKWVHWLLKHPPHGSSGLIQAISDYLSRTQPQNNPSERQFVLAARHLAFLLERGETIYVNCEVRQDGWCNRILFIERVALEDKQLHKTVAKLSCIALEHHPRAFHEHITGPSIVIYKNPIVIEQDAGETGISSPTVELTSTEIVEMYRGKQRLADLIKVPLEYDEFSRKHLEEDMLLIRRAYEATISSRPKAPFARVSHPYRPAQLLILPRLIRVRQSTSILSFISDQLGVIRQCGFHSIMLTPVDKQSLHVYYSETIDGHLVPYVNNHGYWCSGEIGIDPLLGSEQDYRNLVGSAALAGMVITQDCVFGTLGYTAQLSKFSACNIASPTALMIGNDAVEVWDTVAFLHERGLTGDGVLEGEVSPEHYSRVMSTIHRGASFDLPRPNLFNPEIRHRSTARSRWLAETMNVHSFRIDNAKHIGVQPLKNILNDLRKAVRHSLGFSAVLEYWTSRYRDLRFALHMLEGSDDAVYFYDFPLAGSLKKMLVDGADFYSTLDEVQRERSAWDIDLCRLVPTFIDHDHHFTPLYNGTLQSSSLVVCGYAFCLMMSANAPCVYFGFDNARAGTSPDAYDQRSEKTSRRAVDAIFCEDGNSPLQPVSSLLKLIHDLGALECWDGETFMLTGAADWVEIARGFFDRASGERRRLRARFTRNVDAAPPAGECVIFSYSGDLSIAFSVA